MAGLFTAGVPTATFPLTGNELIPADTTLTQGINPDMEAISVAQIVNYSIPAVALVDAATIATNAALGEFFSVTLGGNRTLANPTNLKSGANLFFELVQDATGARTATFDTLYKFVGGTKTLTTTAAAIDGVSCFYDGTVLLCQLLAKYS